MLNDTDPVGDEPIQDDAPKPEAKQPDAGELQRQLEHKERLLDSERRDKEYWFNKATQSQQQAAAPAPIIEEADEDDEFDYLDATANGKSRDIDKRIEKRAEKIAKQIVEKTMKEGGFVSREQAQQIAVQQAEDIRESAQLVQDYPDLQVKGSELQGLTERHLQALEANPAYSGMPPLQQVRIAAERAQNELYRTGRMTQQPADLSQDRQQRIRAQQPGSSNYGAPQQDRAEELTPQQKQLAKIFGVSEKAYVASAKTHRYRKP